MKTTQAAIGRTLLHLFNCSAKTELFENSVLRNFRTTATGGKQLYLSHHEALREAKQ